MSAAAPQPAAILAHWFARGWLPETVALMVDRTDAGCPRGTIFDWDSARQGYKARGADVFIIPAYIRANWCAEFCHAAEAAA